MFQPQVQRQHHHRRLRHRVFQHQQQRGINDIFEFLYFLDSTLSLHHCLIHPLLQGYCWCFFLFLIWFERIHFNTACYFLLKSFFISINMFCFRSFSFQYLWQKLTTFLVHTKVCMSVVVATWTFLVCRHKCLSTHIMFWCQWLKKVAI